MNTIQEIILIKKQLHKLMCSLPMGGGTGGGTGGATMTETDPTVGEHIKAITPEDIEEWNNHLTEEFVVTAPAGSFDMGESFSGKLSLKDAFKALLTKVSVPKFIGNSLKASVNATVIEVGSIFDAILTVTYNRGEIRGALVNNVWNDNAVQNPRTGSPITYDIDGEEYVTSNLVKEVTFPGYKVRPGINSFSATVTYGAGPQPTDSEGNNYSTPASGGTLPASTAFTGAYRTFAGGVSDFPTSALDLRSRLISTSILNAGNSISFNTGKVYRKFVVAIPNDRFFISAVNSGTNETLPFVLAGLDKAVDASGQLVSYKVYQLEIAVPFSNDYKINITIN